MQKLNKRWVKIIVTFKPRINEKERREFAATFVSLFETAFKIEHLYYARYSTLEASSFEVSALTGITNLAIYKFFGQSNHVASVTVEARGTGSLPHAYAYQAVKRIAPFKGEGFDDKEFLDVIHWMANIRGLDYVREERLYAFAALRLSNHHVLEQEKLLKVLTRLAPEIKRVSQQIAYEETAIAMAEEELKRQREEKARSLAKARPRDRLSKLKRSLNVAARKVRASLHSPSVKSAPRSPAKRGRGLIRLGR